MPGTYYIACETAFTENEKRLASEKARDDITRILTRGGSDMTFRELSINFDTGRWMDHPAFVQIGEHLKAKREWEKKTKSLTRGDVLLVQFPAVNHSLFLYRVLKSLKKRGVYLIAVLHDVEAIRGLKRRNKSLKNRLRKYFEEILCLRYFDRLIVHNDRMGKMVAKAMNIPAEKLINLEIFDYLGGEACRGRRDKSAGVIIAGNLTPVKAGYVYRLPEDVRWNLYGVNFAGNAVSAEKAAELDLEKGVVYYGSYPAEEIIEKLEGGFGLVWDGPSSRTCEGVYGEYLRINDPHKTSLYLAAGIPVIIWKEAALAPFILAHECGVTVGSLSEIREIIAGMDEETYAKLRENAAAVGRLLTAGEFTARAAEKAIADRE
ncbi:MAG: hypothetical protein IKF22_12350 [Lachnospiraceae bacterium]|nr:hypothetical protein [Lachnospiraceae bacterium]